MGFILFFASEYGWALFYSLLALCFANSSAFLFPGMPHWPDTKWSVTNQTVRLVLRLASAQFLYLQAGLYGKDFMASIKKADDSHSLAVRVVDWPECCLDLSTVTGAYSLKAPAEMFTDLVLLVADL